MQLTYTSIPLLAVLNVVFITPTLAFPAYADGSMGDILKRQAGEAASSSQFVPKLPPPPPGPLTFSGTKLVDDEHHPWKPLRKGDIRGPCPGLNTLASHGYLPRDGVATPAQIINAVQEGLNMENTAARFVTYGAHLVNGNLVTDLLSIGAKTPKTGPDPPKPAIVGGLNTHGTFEGDMSLTRGDAFFGDNFSFNQTLFDQFKDFSRRYGNGFFNLTVGAELRWERFQQSLATNPEFRIVGLRQISAYGEPAFAINIFTDGRRTGADKGQLDLEAAESFFKDMRFPKGFFRAAQPSAAEGADVIYNAHPTETGRNNGRVNDYIVDNSLGGLSDLCKFYTQFVNVIVKGLYPEPTGVLLRNLKITLGYFYDSAGLPDSCPQVFPYGP